MAYTTCTVRSNSKNQIYTYTYKHSTRTAAAAATAATTTTTSTYQAFYQSLGVSVQGILLGIVHEAYVEPVEYVSYNVNLREQGGELLHSQDVEGVHHVLLVAILL